MMAAGRKWLIAKTVFEHTDTVIVNGRNVSPTKLDTFKNPHKDDEYDILTLNSALEASWGQCAYASDRE